MILCQSTWLFFVAALVGNPNSEFKAQLLGWIPGSARIFPRQSDTFGASVTWFMERKRCLNWFEYAAVHTGVLKL